MKKDGGTKMKLAELTVSEEVESEAREQIHGLVEVADAVRISNDEEYAIAGDLLTGSIKPALKQLDEAFDPIISSWHSGHKQTIKTKKGLAAPLLIAETRIKNLLGKYDVEQTKQKRLAAVAAAQEEARLEREAEEGWRAEEAVRLLEEGDEDAAVELLGLADADDGEGEEEATDIVDIDAGVIAAGAAKVERPKAEGVTVRMLRRYRIVDVTKIRPAYLKPDAQKIQKLVERFGKEAEEAVGGIEFYEVPNVSAQAR